MTVLVVYSEGQFGKCRQTDTLEAPFCVTVAIGFTRYLSVIFRTNDEGFFTFRSITISSG